MIPPMLLPADPGASYRAHREEIDRAVGSVLASGWYILGHEVARFEEEFASYVGTKFCVGVSSGTDALELALRACGIGQGDAVITVSHTAVATVAAIELAGAIPVLIDVDPTTYTIDTKRLEETVKTYLGKSLKAIIPVHLYGHPADMSAIIEIAKRYDLYVIEDCAQAHGAVFHKHKAGSLGHIGAFSFYPTKNLGAIGDGGALVTSDPEIADRATVLRQYGWKERYVSYFAGMNTRLDEIQAAILRVKLRHLEVANHRRREIASIYRKQLSSTRLLLPQESPFAKHVYHQCVISSDRRDDLQKYLQANSVGTAVLYPVPVHLQPAYRGRLFIGAGGLENTEKICHRILSLPVYPELTDEQVKRVAELIISWEAGI